MEADWSIYNKKSFNHHNNRIVKFTKKEMAYCWPNEPTMWFSEAPSSVINNLDQEKLDKREDVNYSDIK